MGRSNFSLADVLTLLTALAFGFVCFLGANFYMLGDTAQSIILAAIVTVPLAGTAFMAKRLKRAGRNFKTNFILEVVVLVLFTGLTVFFAYSPFPHYFNVSEKKTEIQQKLQASIAQAENMFAAYEKYTENRIKMYKGNLESAVRTKDISPIDYINYDFVNSTTDQTQIDKKLKDIRKDLFPTNYTDTSTKRGIKDVATDWLSKAKNTTNDWKPIGVVEVVNQVEMNAQTWKNDLVRLSQKRQKGEETEDFEYDLSFDDVKAHFTTLGAPTPLSIGLAVVAYLLMLLSWLISKRSSKSSIDTVKRKGQYDIEI